MKFVLVEVERRRFPPLSKEALKNVIELTLDQRPEQFGVTACRWTLKAITEAVSNLKYYHLGSVWTLLHSLKVRHVRAREYVHSPDRYYAEKLEYLQNTIRQFDADRQVLYFMDQLTVYLHPSPGYDWVKSGQVQPLCRQGYLSNRSFRICGAVNCFSGEVEVIIRNRIAVPTIVEFFKQLCEKHKGKTVYLVLDNWTVHWHPDLRAAVELQHFPFVMDLPKSWQHLKPRKKYLKMNLPIQLVYLPTYASWLNPIEKVWKWLKQDVIHLHRLTDDFQALKDKVLHWFMQPVHSNEQILKFIGLKAIDGIFSQALNTAISNMSKNV